MPPLRCPKCGAFMPYVYNSPWLAVCNRPFCDGAISPPRPPNPDPEALRRGQAEIREALRRIDEDGRLAEERMRHEAERPEEPEQADEDYDDEDDGRQRVRDLEGGGQPLDAPDHDADHEDGDEQPDE